MKKFFYFLTVLLTVVFNEVIAQVPTQVLVDGNYYTNGQTAYIECGKTEVVISVAPVYDGGSGYLPMQTGTSSNLYVTNGSTTIDKILHLDPNRQDGYIQVGYQGVTGSPYITVYIKQKPPTPTFTATASLCSTGSSGTFSVSNSYSFQSTKPLDIVWQTTGGVTVNGGSTYTTSSATTGSVTIQYNSYGTLSVYGVIPGCGNLQGNAITYWFGAPGGSDVTFTRSGGSDPGPSLCSGSYYNFVSVPELPSSQFSYNWSIPQGSSNVNYFYSYGPNANIGAGSAGGGFILQMNITNIACNTTGGSSRTFFINSCGGFRVANNPATDKLTAIFDKENDAQQLPDILRLSTEKDGMVREVKVKGQYSDQAAKDGFSVDVDVHALPRGTYYLQGIYGSTKKESIRVILQ